MKIIIKTTKTECQISQWAYMFLFFKKSVNFLLPSRKIIKGRTTAKYQILKMTSIMLVL